MIGSDPGPIVEHLSGTGSVQFSYGVRGEDGETIDNQVVATLAFGEKRRLLNPLPNEVITIEALEDTQPENAIEIDDSETDDECGDDGDAIHG
jgi:hypothetical protein